MTARLARWMHTVLLVPAVLPLVYASALMYPLMAPKTLLLRGLGLVALSGWVYLATHGRALYYERLRHWPLILPAILLVVAYLTSLAQPNFGYSFWSSFERGDGLLTLTVCIASLYLIVLTAERTWLSQLLRVVAWVGTLAAGYLIVQWAGLALHLDLPFIAPANGRPGGTMGNAAFLAAYLGMSLWAALHTAYGARSRIHYGWLTAVGLHLSAIVLTATRGTMIALAFIVGGVLVYGAVWGKGRWRTRAYRGLAVLGIGVALFIVFRAELATAPFEPVRRLAAISLTDTTTASRLFLWKNLLTETRTHLGLGYGAEHIDIPFNRVYDPSVLTEEWFDRSHNAYLDYLLQYGVAGLLLYLACVLGLGWVGWRLHRRGERLGYAILGMTSVYALQNLFVFDTGVTLWLICALGGGALVALLPDVKQSTPLPPLRREGTLLALALLVLLVPVVVQPFRANLLAFEAYQYQVSDVPRSTEAFTKGLSVYSFADREYGYNAYFMYTDTQVSTLSGNELVEAYTTTVHLLERSFERYPTDARTAVYLAQVLANPPKGAPPDQGLLSRSLARSLELSPKRAEPWFILINRTLDEANIHPSGSPEREAGYRAAEDLVRRYGALVPNLSLSHFVLAELLWARGEREASLIEAKRGSALYREDLPTALRAAGYYERVRDLPEARFFLSEIVKLDPHNTAAQSDLDLITSHDTP